MVQWEYTASVSAVIGMTADLERKSAILAYFLMNIIGALRKLRDRPHSAVTFLTNHARRGLIDCASFQVPISKGDSLGIVSASMEARMPPTLFGAMTPSSVAVAPNPVAPKPVAPKPAPADVAPNPAVAPLPAEARKPVVAVPDADAEASQAQESARNCLKIGSQ